MNLAQIKTFIENNILDNAFNESKVKDQPTVTTPKEDKFLFNDLAELDICSNVKYSNHFVKCFFKTSKRSYRIEVDNLEDLNIWLQFQNHWFTAIIESRQTKNKKTLVLIEDQPTSNEDTITINDDWQ